MMGDDNYGAALLAMGQYQRQASQWLTGCGGGSGAIGEMVTHIACPVVLLPSKRDKAIAYLRERKLYCLDSPVGRIPPQARPMTLLDKWMKERHK